MSSPRHHPPPLQSPPPAAAPPPPLDLEVTVISAKHLKNVNWRTGNLKPYAVVYLDPDRRSATKPDDSGNLRPVWNERLLLPLPPHHQQDHLLTIDVFHSKPSETPKPLVGTARFPLQQLLDAGAASPIRTLELRRPSGRPQGKIRIKIALRERPPPPPEPNPIFPQFTGYYYSSAPPPPHHQFSPTQLPPYPMPVPRPQPSLQYPNYGGYGEHFTGYYPPAAGYYSAPPAAAAARGPAPGSGYYNRVSGYGSPSAPSEYSSGPPSYDHKPKGVRMGVGTGLAVGAVAGALGGLALEEGLNYEEEKIAERVESDVAAKDDYSDYQARH